MRVPFHVISPEPAIYVSVAGKYLSRVLAAAREGLAGRSATLLLMIWWDGISELPILVAQHKRAVRLYPEISLIYLCNSPDELNAFIEQGMEAILCNHNAFIDENIFIPSKCDKPCWRAVFNGALSPYKRIHLAQEVHGLAIVTYEPSGPTAYGQAMQERLFDKCWVNRDGGAFLWLSSNDVALVLGSALVGLCLSAREGAMYASVEYLLSGVPVVTTPSTGGRDIFFTDETCIMASPQPAAISKAVDSLIGRGLSRQTVRNITLDRLQPHRDRYNTLLRGLNSATSTQTEDSRFVGNYCQRLYQWCELDVVSKACVFY